MRIDFSDGGYIETGLIGESIFITIGAKSQDNINSKIINSAAITKEQLRQLISEFLVENEKQ